MFVVPTTVSTVPAVSLIPPGVSRNRTTARRSRSPPARPAKERMSLISLAASSVTANCRRALSISGSCRSGTVTSNVPAGWAHGLRIETHTRTDASAPGIGTPAAAPVAAGRC